MRIAPTRWKFVAVRTFEKAEKTHTFMTFANPADFERMDFIADKGLDVAKYPQGCNYDVELDIRDGNKTKYVSVIALTPVKA